jgi:hypothetical protein
MARSRSVASLTTILPFCSQLFDADALQHTARRVGRGRCFAKMRTRHLIWRQFSFGQYFATSASRRWSSRAIDFPAGADW